MSRYPRSFVVGYPHHIVQRGHDRQPVFVADDDYACYVENLREQKQAMDVRVYAWCLMTNHVHLILEPCAEAAAISRLMRILAARQTRRTNRLEGRTGTLWEGRFKSSLVDSEAYLLACLRYVELNPVRATVVAEPENYRWSSCRDRFRQRPVDWLDEHPVYLRLGADRRERQRRYRNLLTAGVPDDELAFIRRAVQRNQLTGSERFADAIVARIGRRIEARGPGRPRKASLRCVN